MAKKTSAPFWKQYEPMIQAIVELFHPFVEAAIHDLKEGKIVAIFHNISQRKIGELSPLHELNVNVQDLPDRFPPYYKRNWDGRPLKCTSITLRNSNGNPIGLVCFNVDTSLMHEMQNLLQTFLATQAQADNPVELFGSNAEEQIQLFIQEYLTENQYSMQHLNRDQKKQLVQFLYRKGVFNFKNAAPLVAQLLKISRATVYNHLKELGD